MMKYTVKKGDTLSGIARTFLGDGARWPDIVTANRKIKDPDKIYPGMVLDIPMATASPPLAPDRRSTFSKIVDFFSRKEY